MFKDEKTEELYNYLHEKFYYRDDGTFIKKTDGLAYEGVLETKTKKLIFNLEGRIKNKKIKISYAHAIYLYHKKIRPKYINTINGNDADLRIENLYSSTMSERIYKSNHINNKTGFRGVIKDGKKYHGRVWVKGKYIWLTGRKTAKEAYDDYLKYKNEKIKTLSEKNS